LGIDNEPVDPNEYVKIYNTLVPAMQQVDPSLKFVATELSGTLLKRQHK